MNNINNVAILNFDLEMDEILYLLTRAVGKLNNIQSDVKDNVRRSIADMIFQTHLIRDEIHKDLAYLVPHLGMEMEKDMPRK